jgi:hypothetical protein
VLSLQNGGGFKIPWRDDRGSASRVVSVIQTTFMRLDYEIRSTVAGHRLQLSNLSAATWAAALARAGSEREGPGGGRPLRYLDVDWLATAAALLICAEYSVNFAPRLEVRKSAV